MKTDKNTLGYHSNNDLKRTMLLISYNDNIYDVLQYEHPGDGICGAFLGDYKNKQIDDEFKHYHTTDEPYENMKLASQKKHPEIHFICRNYFGKKIPKYLYYDKKDLDGKKYSCCMDIDFSVIPKNVDRDKPELDTFIFIYKQDDKIYDLVINQEEKKWMAVLNKKKYGKTLLSDLIIELEKIIKGNINGQTK